VGTGFRAIIPESGGQTKNSRLTRAGVTAKGMKMLLLLCACEVVAASLLYAVFIRVWR